MARALSDQLVSAMGRNLARAGPFGAFPRYRQAATMARGEGPSPEACMNRIRILAVPTLALVCVACGGGTTDSPKGGTNPTTPQASQTSTGDPSLTGTLLFSRFSEANHEFISTHTAKPDGSGEVEVEMPGPEGGGRWSWSGEEIAVMTVLPDDRIGTAVIDAEGNVLRTLSIPGKTLNLVCATWARDDKRLACEGWDNSDATARGIYSVDSSDGGHLLRLTRSPGGLVDFPGDFSPDGKSLLFKRAGGDGEDPGPLFTVPVAGGTPQKYTDVRVEDPGRFSPDGNQVLTSSHGVLLILDDEGKVSTRIVEPNHYLFGPVWSPDGSHIAYSNAFGGPYANVYTSLPDGTDQRQVTDTVENEIAVEWGPL